MAGSPLDHLRLARPSGPFCRDAGLSSAPPGAAARGTEAQEIADSFQGLTACRARLRRAVRLRLRPPAGVGPGRTGFAGACPAGAAGGSAAHVLVPCVLPPEASDHRRCPAGPPSRAGAPAGQPLWASELDGASDRSPPCGRAAMGCRPGRRLPAAVQVCPGGLCSAEVAETADPAGGFWPGFAIAPAEGSRCARHQPADHAAARQARHQRFRPDRR